MTSTEVTTVVPNGAAAIDFLNRDGNSIVPCSRYGSDTIECAPVAWQAAKAYAEATGDPITFGLLDHLMGLVVNDHDDVAYLIENYGGAR